MKSKFWLTAMLVALVAPAGLKGDNLWDRRDPNMANLFKDFRARMIGDLLTISIEENTGFEGMEKREMEKKTAANGQFNTSGNSSALGQVLRGFGADFSLDNSSQRKFDGKANSTIDRRFTDRLTVVVIGVMPNGNLIVEGFRQRVIARETRTLRIYGIVRPADIGPANIVQSQFVADLRVFYDGRGPESSYTNQGWGGRIFNKLWPH